MARTEHHRSRRARHPLAVDSTAGQRVSAEQLPKYSLGAWCRSPLSLTVTGCLLFWAALPPLSWWPLGWIAPAFWIWLARRPQWIGRHPYLMIWGVSAVYWMVVMQGIRLAHWANYLGLVALGAYLGIYLPLFLAVTRLAVHQLRFPLLAAAPLAWTGIELIRGYGPLGFSMALLAHTQVSRPLVIQMADIFGAYGISFIMVLTAAAGVSVLVEEGWRRYAAAGVAGAALAVVLAYGSVQLQNPSQIDSSCPPVRVALIQGSIDTIFEDNPQRPAEILDQYTELTLHARRQYGAVDLVVWPETMFPLDEIVVDEQAARLQLDPSWDARSAQQLLDENAELFGRVMRNGVRLLQDPLSEHDPPAHSTYWMLGTTTWLLGDHPPRRYNTAMLVDPNARIVGRYFKMHPVIFGEYVPFGEWIPALYRLFPLPNGLTPGTEPLAVTVANLTFSPSICFENTMPHMIRHHVATLDRQGQSPDVLVNLTNDGWFWGSSILDMQLDCAVFRAVELRRPFLVAANTGFSAWIDGNGQIRAQGPRRATGTLLAEVQPDGRDSLYQWWGDGPVAACALFCLLVGIGAPVWNRWQQRGALPTS